MPIKQDKQNSMLLLEAILDMKGPVPGWLARPGRCPLRLKPQLVGLNRHLYRWQVQVGVHSCQDLD